MTPITITTGNTDRPELFFFDAHGGLWATCGCADGRAQAFGPRHCARPVTDGAEVAELGFSDDGDNNGNLYVRATAAGRVLHADPDDCTAWDVLLPVETQTGADIGDAAADIMAVAGGTMECRGTPGPGGVELFAPLPERPGVEQEA